jgi:hypothetical protein
MFNNPNLNENNCIDFRNNERIKNGKSSDEEFDVVNLVYSILFWFIETKGKAFFGKFHF